MNKGEFDIICALNETSLGFSASPERELLRGNADDLPGVMAAAYARYIARSIYDRCEPSRLKKLLRPFEEMASLHSDFIHSVLRDEVFERFEVDGVTAAVAHVADRELLRMIENWLETSK